MEVETRRGGEDRWVGDAEKGDEGVSGVTGERRLEEGSSIGEEAAGEGARRPGDGRGGFVGD